jgi:hypothetical protein
VNIEGERNRIEWKPAELGGAARYTKAVSHAPYASKPPNGKTTAKVRISVTRQRATAARKLTTVCRVGWRLQNGTTDVPSDEEIDKRLLDVGVNSVWVNLSHKKCTQQRQAQARILKGGITLIHYQGKDGLRGMAWDAPIRDCLANAARFVTILKGLPPT